MNQISKLYNGNLHFEIYVKTTILIILYITKGNGIRELMSYLTYLLTEFIFVSFQFKSIYSKAGMLKPENKAHLGEATAKW